MHGFELTVQHMGSGAVGIRLRGALDLAYAYRFDDELRHAERDATSCLVLDLRELDFVDSAGISRILAARRRARRSGRRLVLVRGSTAVQRFLQVAALTEHFEFVTDPADAMPAREGAEGTEVAATPPRQASALAGPMPQAAPAAPSD